MESIAVSIRCIFGYLNGVLHTIWFDKDNTLVKIDNLENGTIRRTLSDTFTWFRMHYEFNEVFMNPNRGHEKCTVEQVVRFIRRSIFVPPPSFDDLDTYNLELLDRVRTF